MSRLIDVDELKPCRFAGGGVAMLYIVCFSGGHSSALAAIETVHRYGKENVILLNHDICEKTEHADIKRFKREVAEYLGLDITQADMPGCHCKDQFDVCVEKKAFKYGTQTSALCTRALKTEPFYNWLADNYPSSRGKLRADVTVVYGFDPTEKSRIARRTMIMAEMGYKTEYPLTMPRTVEKTEDVGIARPSSYKIFNHANCVGCLKAGKQHWYAVYCLYPDVWGKAKWAEEQIGHSILKQGYLKDLEEEFAELKEKGMPATEKIKPQTFWALARKIKEDKT